MSNGVWYCGTGYGNFADCVYEAGTNLIGASCDEDGGTCFSCYYESAGLTCGCLPGDGGGLAWRCVPSGTGCRQ